MPLSEEELRVLEQMERALVQDDPKLASTMRGTPFRRTARRRAVIAGVAFVVGVTLLMTGAIAAQWIVGVVGFVVMLGSATVFVTSMRPVSQTETSAPEAFSGAQQPFTVLDGGRKSRPAKAARAPRSQSSFMERMEERWRRRREGY